MIIDISKRSVGLSRQEVERSRAAYGINVLTPPPAVPLWRRFLSKFSDPLIIILLVAGVLSVGISCYEYLSLDRGAGVFFEPLGILIAVLLATGLAFVFELKAEREFEVLNAVNDDEPVQVVRDGKPTVIARRDVVVGDIVALNAGDEVPADGTLLEAVRLSVDESTLTGEPLAHKTVDESEFSSDSTYADNMVLRGTKVMEGHGVMCVSAVGDATENGKVHKASQLDNGVRTPLDEQLVRLGSMISRMAYVVGAIVIAGRLAMFFVHHSLPIDWLEFVGCALQSFMLAVALVVCMVPEGLPMAVTLSLAYSMRRMLRTNNLVRKLHACETMGATTVICTDKTGTLTQNRMAVRRMELFGAPSDDIIYNGIAVNSTAELDRSSGTVAVVGNPTEGALLLWLDSRGVDYSALRRGATVVDELPFSTERKYMVTVVERGGKRMAYVKGAPEIVFALCQSTPELTRDELDEHLLEYQNRAMRTLGFAYAPVAEGRPVIADGRFCGDGLIFTAVAAISDPVREDVPEAVKDVMEAGIDVKIVTGDTPATAREIGRQTGLWDDSRDTDANIVTGPDVAAMDDAELGRRAADIKIIARARPMDKKRLVEALQSRGEVVAVTGDGTNDAPALKAAHVGLSMGDGTAVAKEASDITIIDNSFASIGRAVMWGRSLYKNIQRFVLFQMTVNIVACMIVICGAFMDVSSPLTVTQMLWVNLIMDTFAAMALASLPPTSSVMHESPRRRSDFIITGAMWRQIVGVGLAIFAVLLLLLIYFNHTDIRSLTDIGRVPYGTDKGLSAYELSLFFTIFVFLQFWNMFNARAFATGRSAFHFRDCGGFESIALAIVGGQIAIVTFGGRFFNTVPLKLSDWLIIAISSSAVLWIGEASRQISKFTRHK